MSEKHERDSNGNLTPMALALDALENEGCDCGVDEPGTCIVCLCKTALTELDQDREAAIENEILATSKLEEAIAVLRGIMELSGPMVFDDMLRRNTTKIHITLCAYFDKAK